MITKRNIILFVATLLFAGINFFGTNLFIDSKVSTIKHLEEKHKEENEKYITAQILSQKFEHVYSIFTNNLVFIFIH